ncbi:NAD(P)H-binding protein [Paenarthrobacter sp. FR1]|uniref:NAD(P)H-binding protein n=1 Tax=Paenarthrobacter sp. FR1 TaxID=3439548 RepID=UPI003DA3D662
MRIAVATPSGHVGRHLVPMLIRAGVRPLVLAREPDSLALNVRAEVDAVRVDLLDADAVVQAVSGVDSLYWVDPSPVGDEPLAEYGHAAISVARAVTEGGVRRVVFQSSVGAEKRHGVGEIDGLAATEVALDQTDADVTHLRCGYFFTNLEYQLDAIQAGKLQVLLPLDQAMAWVAPRDIAEVAASRLLSRQWRGHQIQAVHGPADLSWRQVARIVSEATARPLAVERITEDAMRAALEGFGMSVARVDSIIGMSAGFLDGFEPEQKRSLQTTTPTALAAWAYDELRPLLTF